MNKATKLASSLTGLFMLSTTAYAEPYTSETFQCTISGNTEIGYVDKTITLTVNEGDPAPYDDDRDAPYDALIINTYKNGRPVSNLQIFADMNSNRAIAAFNGLCLGRNFDNAPYIGNGPFDINCSKNDQVISHKHDLSSKDAIKDIHDCQRGVFFDN